MANSEKILVTEHMLEVRHAAVGSFLDVRGYVADKVRGKSFLPHWKIDSNVVVFLDNPEKPSLETAFAGYKSFGYTVFNPPHKSFFQQRASSFIKIILKNGQYQVHNVTRFGCRTKAFIPCDLDFISLNNKIHDSYFSSPFRESITDNPTDIQIVSEFSDTKFNARVTLGPMHENEASKHFNFQSDSFSSVGLFLDIDYFLGDGCATTALQRNLDQAMDRIWAKVKGISKTLGV